VHRALKRLEADGVQQVLFTSAQLDDIRLVAREVMPAFA